MSQDISARKPSETGLAEFPKFYAPYGDGLVESIKYARDVMGRSEDGNTYYCHQRSVHWDGQFVSFNVWGYSYELDVGTRGEDKYLGAALHQELPWVLENCVSSGADSLYERNIDGTIKYIEAKKLLRTEFLWGLEMVKLLALEREQERQELIQTQHLPDSQYNLLVDRILNTGTVRSDRTGTGTIGTFGEKMSFDLSQSKIPVLTGKRVFWKGVVAELLWFLSGSTNVRPLQEQGVHIWDAWADEDGNLGPVYGKQWTNWNGFNQIKAVIRSLKDSPSGRRHIVSAWNVEDLPEMALPPCHLLFQFYARELTLEERIAAGDYMWHEIERVLPEMQRADEDFHAYLDFDDVPRHALSCQIYQRSADMFLGVPFNIASYALLTHLMAREVGMVAERLHWVGGDCHIYQNHVGAVREQLDRDLIHGEPLLVLENVTDNESMFDLRTEQLLMENYHPHPSIKAPVAV